MASSETFRVDESARALTLAAHAAFVPIGMVTVLLAPLLPALSERWSLSYEQAGALFTAQFAGSTLGVAASGLVTARWGFRLAIKAGLLAMAIGTIALPLCSYRLGICSIAAYGVGLGLAIPAANLLVAEVNPARRSAALSLLNFSWSAGAVACAFAIAAATKAHRIADLLWALGALLVIVLLGITTMPSRIREPEVKIGASSSRIEWHARALPVLMALFFLYIGVENAFGGWIALYAKSLGRVPTALAVMSPSFFYLALLFGRWLAPIVLERINDIRWARAEILIACAGMAGMILSHSTATVIASAIVAGCGLAAVYPITISLLSREFGGDASRVGSITFTMSNFGGASLPWLVGLVSSRSGSLRFGLAVPLVGTVAIYLLYLSKWRTAQSTTKW